MNTFRGQGSLLGLPNTTTAPYKPPKRLLSGDLEVWKITKDGKRVSRFIQVSSSKRVIEILNPKGIPILKSGNSVRRIFISQIESIVKRSYSPRFILHAEKTSRNLDKAIQGKNSSLSQKIYSQHAEAEERSISITYYIKEVQCHFDFIVPIPEEYDLLFSALNSLLLDYKRYKSRVHTDISFLQHLYETVLQIDPIDATVSFGDLQKALSRGLKGMVPNSTLKHSNLSNQYKSFLSLETPPSNDSRISFQQALNFLRDIRGDFDLPTSPNPMDMIWKLACGSNYDERKAPSEIDSKSFLKFMNSYQKETKWSLDYVKELFHRLNQLESYYPQGLMQRSSLRDTIDRITFESFLLSDANDVFDPLKGIIGRYDMSQPLSHYYINTSHSTYLNDDGSADIRMYTENLSRGCRCVEIDVWDGVDSSPKDPNFKEPIVCKDLNAKSSILFSDVIRVIRAFLISNPETFPIVLSIENHCSISYQSKIAYHLKSILGELLYIPISFDGPLPSPESLKGMAVVKARRPSKIKNEIAYVSTDDFDVKNTEEPNDEHLPITESNLSSPSNLDFDEGEIYGNSIEMAVEATTLEANRLKVYSKEAEEQAFNLSVDSKRALAVAEKLLAKLGLSMKSLEGKTEEEIRTIINCPQPQSSYSVEKIQSNSPTTVNGLEKVINDQNKSSEQGFEINNYSQIAVDEKKKIVARTRDKWQRLKENSSIALVELTDAQEEYNQAKTDVDNAEKRNKEAQDDANKAAIEARQNQEHAYTSRKRVETVQEYLQKCKKSAASSESFSITALTEMKISQQRAIEAEARAEKTLHSAMLDRQRADQETAKEESFLEEADLLKNACFDATYDAQKARDRMEEAKTTLDSIEDTLGISDILDGNQMSPRKKDKLSQDKMYLTHKVKEASAENAAAEMIRRHAQSAYDEALNRAKIQSDRAAQARKQAEQSALIADRLAEHAEEERAAADLRKTANLKADLSLEQTEDNLKSAEAQYKQAKVANEESEKLAQISREKADELTEAAILARMLTTERASLLSLKEETLQLKQDKYNQLENDLRNVQRSLEEAESSLITSVEICTRAAVEISERNHSNRAHELLIQDTFNAVIEAQKMSTRADEAKEQAISASKAASDKFIASRQADIKRRKFQNSMPIIPSLSQLVLLSSNKFKSWAKTECLPNSEILSVNDTNVSFIARRGPSDRSSWVQFNCSHITRVFPSAAREGKSNINPVIPWSLGCQLVGLNTRICDAELMLNDGRFRENGSCGYVLKNGRLTNPKKYEMIPQESSRIARIRILSGLNLCMTCCKKEGTTHPYVNIAICDGNTGKISTCQTSAVKRNSLKPVWNEEIPALFTVESPSLAMVIFSVWDKQTDTFIASSSMPFRGLSQGYRSVPLFNASHSRSGYASFSSLLVEVKFD